MLEIAQILGFFSAILLIVAVVAWMNLGSGRRLQRLDGHVEPNTAQTELASQLLLLAAGSSALAAFLAVVGWVAG